MLCRNPRRGGMCDPVRTHCCFWSGSHYLKLSRRCRAPPVDFFEAQRACSVESGASVRDVRRAWSKGDFPWRGVWRAYTAISVSAATRDTNPDTKNAFLRLLPSISQNCTFAGTPGIHHQSIKLAGGLSCIFIDANRAMTRLFRWVFRTAETLKYTLRKVPKNLLILSVLTSSQRLWPQRIMESSPSPNRWWSRSLRMRLRRR